MATPAPLPEVSSCLPDKWKSDLTHRVILHLDYIEDHTVAPLDDFTTSADMVPYEPITSRLPRSLGAIDGTSESKGGLAACLQALRQMEDIDENLTREERRNASGRRQPRRRPTEDDHPLRFNYIYKDEDDDAGDDSRHN